MRKSLLAALLAALAALAAQLVLLPLVARELNAANAFLALLAVLALKQRGTAAVLWGAALGGLSDLLLMQHVGYHGLSFTLLGYGLGWLGSKMVISGAGSLFALTALLVALDAAVVTLLFAGLERAPAAAALGPPLLVSALVTPSLAVGLEALYLKVNPGGRR